MGFQRIQSPSLKKLFITQLEHMILSGELEVGERIPAERDLAEQMGVSRTVINAGIADMATNGFLEIRPRKGVFVADYRRTGSLATLTSIMEFNGGLLPNRDIKSFLEVRQAMEVLCLRLAIPIMTEDGLAILRARINTLEVASTPQETAEARFEFGHELDCLSGNTLLPLLGHSFKQPCVSMWAEYGRKHGIKLLKDHCVKTLGFIENKDVEGAVAFTKHNLGQAIEGDRQIYGSR